VYGCQVLPAADCPLPATHYFSFMPLFQALPTLSAMVK
jgi:hypothetical protein